MSNEPLEAGDLAEVYFGGDVWVRARVIEGGKSSVAVRFPDGTIDCVKTSGVRRISPLRLLAEQSE